MYFIPVFDYERKSKKITLSICNDIDLLYLRKLLHIPTKSSKEECTSQVLIEICLVEKYRNAHRGEVSFGRHD